MGNYETPDQRRIMDNDQTPTTPINQIATSEASKEIGKAFIKRIALGVGIAIAIDLLVRFLTRNWGNDIDQTD